MLIKSKNILLIFITIAFFIIVTDCAVSNLNYSITFQNASDKAVSLIFGKNIIFAANGANVTYYYFLEDSNAIINFGGIKVEKSYYLTIQDILNNNFTGSKEIKGMELKKGFLYTVKLSLSDGKYYWGVGATYSGDDKNASFPSYIF